MRIFIKCRDMPLVGLTPQKIKKVIKMVRAADGTFVAKNHK